MSNLIVLESEEPIVQKRKAIFFISDLHFDYTKGKYNEYASKQIEDDFISFVKENYRDSILCLAGDYYDDYKKTLAFAKRLEENGVTGFFVLGNHDFWNDGTMSYSDIIGLFIAETQNHQHFKFLTTGLKYYFDDVCIIGDTGWTSFERKGGKANLFQFIMSLPEFLRVKKFSLKEVINMHEKWVLFANNVLEEELKVLMVTHFSMANFTEEDRDLWWSSTTNLIKKDSWRLFGHSHNKKQQRSTNISSQRGFRNYSVGTSGDELDHNSKKGIRDKFASILDKKYLKNFTINDKRSLSSEGIVKQQYTSRDFGELKPVFEFNVDVPTYGLKNLTNFYNSILVSKENPNPEMVYEIKKRGYKRCASNKDNFAALAKSSESYLARVRHTIKDYLPTSCIGYTYSPTYMSYRVTEAVYHSIKIIEAGNFSDIRSYMTAAIITGYVYNGRVYEIDGMRPLDDYDIIRLWLMFLTIQSFNIDARQITNVVAQKKKKFEFQNVELYLPAVNNLSLEVEDVLSILQQTALLTTSHQITDNPVKDR